MTLQSAIEAELPYLRDEANARMVDTFDIKVPTGTAYVGGVDVTTYDDLFTTQGYVGADQVTPREVEVGDRTLVTLGRGVRIPWDSDNVPTGAEVECTAIGPLTPPRHLGKRYRVLAAEDASAKPFCNLAIIEELN